MNKRRPKSRLTKCDLNTVLELQRKYDDLQADCKDLLSIVVNLIQGNDESAMLVFNDPHGLPSVTLDLIRKHAAWSKEPINKD